MNGGRHAMILDGHLRRNAPPPKKVIDDSFYFGVEEEEEADDAQQFPAMYPFSATVPEIGLALLKVRRPPPTGSAVFVFALPTTALGAEVLFRQNSTALAVAMEEHRNCTETGARTRVTIPRAREIEVVLCRAFARVHVVE